MGNRSKFTVDLKAFHEKVTGSCILISVHRPDGDIKFLVDCGMYQGEDDAEVKNYAPFKFKPENINFTLVTHCHMDHIGRLPLLYKNGYYGKIYSTEDTKEILPIALNDTVQILQNYADINHVKPLYNCTDVERTIAETETRKFKETFSPYPGVKVTFFKNGHLIGAAVILVQISYPGNEDINLLFTGDYKEKNQFFACSKIPEWVRKLRLYIICESTYGHEDENQIDENQLAFIDNIQKWIVEKKTVFVFAIALERYQEVLYELKCAQEIGKIDKNIPIYLDGNLAIKYTNKFRKGNLSILSKMRDFMPENYCYVDPSIREQILTSNTPKIVVTTAGMGTFGPAQVYIPNFIDKDNVGMHFTSFLPFNTLGYELMSTKKDDIIPSLGKLKKAEVCTTKRFSAHSKQRGIMRFLSQFENIQTIFFNHGEPDVVDCFCDYCEQNLTNCKDYAILGRQEVFRVDSWKITKVIREKG